MGSSSERRSNRAITKGFRNLVVAIRADNPGALAFYRAMCFKVVESARKQASVDGELIEQIVAEKQLGA